jgi:hypothetical protein
MSLKRKIAEKCNFNWIFTWGSQTHGTLQANSRLRFSVEQLNDMGSIPIQIFQSQFFAPEKEITNKKSPSKSKEIRATKLFLQHFFIEIFFEHLFSNEV